MELKEKPPLEGLVGTRVRQTHRSPAEWIITLRDGRRVHIVATKTSLLISIGNDLNEVLLKAKSGDVIRVPHMELTQAVTSPVMLMLTGLALARFAVVNDEVPGDVR
jgi:hypothetical protein